MKEITGADVRGKKVIVRCGFDVPIKSGLSENGISGNQILDDSRIRASIPTIKYLIDEEASQVILISHLGRPEGKENPEFKLEPVAKELVKIFGGTLSKKTVYGDEDFTWQAYQITDKIIMLENIRFNEGEEKNSERLGRQLASLGDIFVNDAFSVSHRANSSIDAITQNLPSYAGMSLVKEVNELLKLTKNPERPFGVIIGGAKTEDKLPAVKNLSTLADFFILGGVVANTFLVARGHNIGKSKYDKEFLADAKRIWTQIMDEPKRDIFLPRDFIISKQLTDNKEQKTIDLKDIEQIKNSEYSIVDIGPKTQELYEEKIKDAKTIFWNGNLGITEVKEFAEGSENIAKSIAKSECYSVIGGGDTGAFINQIGFSDKFDYISTGGGATLEFLAGKPLPGIKALEE